MPDNGETIWAALAAILNEDEITAAHILAEPFGAPPQDIPSIMSAMSTIAVVRQYGRYREQGETHWHAAVRTSRQTGIPTTTIIYRVKRVGLEPDN